MHWRELIFSPNFAGGVIRSIFFQAKGMGREKFEKQLLKALSDFLVISKQPKLKGLPCLPRAGGTHCSSSCFISFPVKKAWEQHGRSQAVCAREMSVIGIFGRVTEKERLHWWEKSTGLHLQSRTPALWFYSPKFLTKSCCTGTSIDGKLYKEKWGGKYALTLKTRNEAGNQINGVFSLMPLVCMN